MLGDLDVARATADLASNQADLFAVRRSRAEMENALATLLGCPASDFRLGHRPLIDTRMPNIPPGLPSAPARAPSRRCHSRAPTGRRQRSHRRGRCGVFSCYPAHRSRGIRERRHGRSLRLAKPNLADWPQHHISNLRGGAHLANLRAAQSRYRQQVDTYRRQVLAAFQDVENALADLHTLSDQSDAQERAVAAAVQALQLAQSQYDQGASNFLDVLDAERTLLADERVSVQLLGQRLQATVLLIKALGGTW